MLRIETVFMLTMIVLSRLFLWQVDLFNVATIQQFVPQSRRVSLHGSPLCFGTHYVSVQSEVTATQAATGQLLEMLMGVFGMLLSRPSDFKVFVYPLFTSPCSCLSQFLVWLSGGGISASLGLLLLWQRLVLPRMLGRRTGAGLGLLL